MKKIFVAIAAIIVASSFTFLSACANKSDVNDNYNNDQVPPADTGEETPENPTDDGEGDGEDEESSVKLSEDEWRAAIEASASADSYTYTIDQSVVSSTSQGSASYHTFGTAYIEQNELFFDFEVLDKLYDGSDDSAFIYDDISGYLQYVYIDEVQQNSVCYMQSFNDDGIASEWEHYYTGSESLFYTNILINTLLSIEYRNADCERIGTIADIYDYITYDEATDTYSVELEVAGLYDSDGQFIENTAEGLRYNMTFAFDGGYLSAFSMSYGDGTTIPKTQMSCTFSDYGSTEIVLPEDLYAML